MNEVVFVSTIGMAASIGFIVVGALAAGALLYWIETNTVRDEEH